MTFVEITATINEMKFEAVENILKGLNVPGLSVSDTKGFGAYKNHYHSDWMAPYVRLQVYVQAADAERIATAIIEAAHEGLDSDGVVAVSPVDRLFRISDKREIKPE